jgi:hypothetical protein
MALSFCLLLGYFLISSLNVKAQECPPLADHLSAKYYGLRRWPNRGMQSYILPANYSPTVTLNFADRLLSYNSVSINGGGNSAIVAPGSS